MDTEIIKKGMNMAEGMGKFLAPLIQGSLEQTMGMVEDKLRYTRWERQMRLKKCVNQKLQELGITEIENPLPLKFAVPLVEGATLEENDDLQDLWANLLINSVANKKVEMKRAYMDILERISPLEAAIIEKVYTFSFEENRHKSLATDCLPDYVYIYERKEKQDNKIFDLENKDVELALMNLSSIGCISPTKSIGGGEFFAVINMTLLGYKLHEACTL